MKKWVFLFPGQGSQYVGMGREFFDSYVEVRELFAQAADILQMDVEKLCFEGPEETLVRTENVQPAITVMNLACLTVLRLHEIYPFAAAGHSLGEYSALYAAGVLDVKDLLTMVRWRGILMQEAADQTPGSMAAVMDLEEEKLQEICHECRIEVANINSPGQIIITGPVEGVDQAMTLSSDAGAKKCVKLNVSGPWHSRCMQFAKDKFEPIVRGCNFHDPSIPVINNIDACPLPNAEAVTGKLVNQLCSPVLWRHSVEQLIGMGYDHFVEVGPKTVLKGLMRRIDRNAKAMNVEDPASLTAFLSAN